MKLLTQTTLYFITISLFVFLLGGIGLYLLMQNLVEKEVDSALFNRIHYFLNEVNKTKSLKNVKFIATEPIEIEKISHPELKKAYQLKDTVLYNQITKTYSPYRRLTTYINSGNAYYQVRIYKSLISSNILIEKVALVTTLMLLLFLLMAYFLNRYLFAKVWSDFFITLNKIQDFSLTKPQKEAFGESEIIEFNALNKVLNKMTDKIIFDYKNVKEFTGNLSHEVQTPLSIIKNKTELLIQENLNERQFELAGSINSATNRLSGIVKSLGLIARIDKGSFTDTEKINFQKLIEDQIHNFQPLIDASRININFIKSDNLQFIMSKELSVILINNLIKNAIRHNVKNGFIRIILDNNSLIIENSGTDPGMPTELLFDQFTQGSDGGTMGVGLSIIKKIADHYKIRINYQYKKNVHKILLHFPS